MFCTIQHKFFRELVRSGFFRRNMSLNLTLPAKPDTITLVGAVAQWLGRRSVAGGLSLIYAWSIVDVWPLGG